MTKPSDSPVRTDSLNGGQTQPLKAASVEVLASLRGGAIPCQGVNAGVVDRLTRGPVPLARREERPNPFPSSRKRNPMIGFLVITDDGLRELQRRGLA